MYRLKKRKKNPECIREQQGENKLCNHLDRKPRQTVRSGVWPSHEQNNSWWEQSGPGTGCSSTACVRGRARTQLDGRILGGKKEKKGRCLQKGKVKNNPFGCRQMCAERACTGGSRVRIGGRVDVHVWKSSWPQTRQGLQRSSENSRVAFQKLPSFQNTPLFRPRVRPPLPHPSTHAPY